MQQHPAGCSLPACLLHSIHQPLLLDGAGHQERASLPERVPVTLPPQKAQRAQLHRPQMETAQMLTQMLSRIHGAMTDMTQRKQRQPSCLH